MCFLELQRAILVHYIFFFAPLASVMRDLAQGAAQKNPCSVTLIGGPAGE